MEYHQHVEERPLAGLRSTQIMNNHSHTGRGHQLDHALRHYPMQPLLRWTYRRHLWWNRQCGSTRGV